MSKSDTGWGDDLRHAVPDTADEAQLLHNVAAIPSAGCLSEKARDSSLVATIDGRTVRRNAASHCGHAPPHILRPWYRSTPHSSRCPTRPSAQSSLATCPRPSNCGIAPFHGDGLIWGGSYPLCQHTIVFVSIRLVRRVEDAWVVRVLAGEPSATDAPYAAVLVADALIAAALGAGFHFASRTNFNDRSMLLMKSHDCHCWSSSQVSALSSINASAVQALGIGLRFVLRLWAFSPLPWCERAEPSCLARPCRNTSEVASVMPMHAVVLSMTMRVPGQPSERTYVSPAFENGYRFCIEYGPGELGRPHAALKQSRRHLRKTLPLMPPMEFRFAVPTKVSLAPILGSLWMLHCGWLLRRGPHGDTDVGLHEPPCPPLDPDVDVLAGGEEDHAANLALDGDKGPAPEIDGRAGVIHT